MQKKKSKFKTEETVFGEPSVVDGELLEDSGGEEVATQVRTSNRKQISNATTTNENSNTDRQKSFLQYIIIPFIFLTVALLGGLRFGAEEELG